MLVIIYLTNELHSITMNNLQWSSAQKLGILIFSLYHRVTASCNLMTVRYGCVSVREKLATIHSVGRYSLTHKI